MTDAHRRTDKILERLHDLSQFILILFFLSCVIFLNKKKWKTPGKTLEKPRENRGKPRENPGKNPGQAPGKPQQKPWENPRKTLGKPPESGYMTCMNHV